MTWCTCGGETIVALTSAGHVVDLDVEHAWASSPEEWSGLFILGVAGGRSGAAVPQATLALAVADGRSDGRPAGPFRREHRCPAVVL